MKSVLTIVSLFLLSLYAAVEILLSTPVAWWLYITVLALFAIGLLRRRPIHLQARRAGVFVVTVLGVAVLYLVPWSSRKIFLHDFYRIRIGMTEAEVRRTMNHYMVATGQPSTPAGSFVENSLVFRHSNAGEFDADFGLVNFKDGKVTEVSFSPD